MAMYVRNNIVSLQAQDNLSASQNQLATAIQQMSSGLRINNARDDAAGYAIASRMGSQISGMNQAVRNANDAISLSQTAGGAMSSITADLQRMRDLAVQASNSTYSSTDRASMQAEVSQLQAEITRIATSTQFNGVNLLNGTFTAQNFQVGPNASDTISMSSISNLQASALGGTNSAQEVSVTGGTVTNALAAGDLTLNGQTVGASSNYSSGSLGQESNSAFAIAAAINAVNSASNVTATANAATASLTVTGTGSYASASIVINGINVGSIAAGANTVGEAANIAYAINQISSQTGVTATAVASSNTVSLTGGSAGGDIIVTAGSNPNATTAMTAAGFATSGVTYHGSVTLTDSTDTQIFINGNAATSAGFTASTTGVTTPATNAYNTISALNISTQTGANAAIATIDAALNTVNTAAGLQGAYQNRFAAVVSNLQNSVQNLTAAQGQIQNTDFAATTAALTQAQVLQQAGTAMLAQANAMPNAVLTLLK